MLETGLESIKSVWTWMAEIPELKGIIAIAIAVIAISAVFGIFFRKG